MNKIIVLPFAEIDLKESTDFYESVQSDLKTRFINAIDNAFKTIGENPKAYPVVKYEIENLLPGNSPFAYIISTRRIPFLFWQCFIRIVIPKYGLKED